MVTNELSFITDFYLESVVWVEHQDQHTPVGFAWGVK